MRVAVVGAGFAGLAAADAIARGGAEPVVFEARDRVGGRVHSQTLPNGAVIELGAEFVLPGYTALREEVARFGLGFWDKGMRYGDREPRGVTVPEGAMEAAVATIEAALADGAEGESVAALLARLEIDEGARAAIVARAEVSAGAPSESIPAADLGLLARVGGEPAPTIAGGNARLAEALQAALPAGSVSLATPVRSITVAEEGVEIGTAAGRASVDSCVIAVPYPLLDEIAIEPALPAAVAAALRSVVYGHVAKLFVPLAVAAPPSATLAVPDRYWAWTATGEGDRPQPVVSAFAGSPAGLRALGVADGPERWLQRLTELRPDLSFEPEAVEIANWDADPWARGGYSVEVTDRVRKLLQQPLGPGGRIVLAGEYLGGEMAALMEGALRSGRTAAGELLRRPL